MANIFEIGISGLNAAQRVLVTTSHNVVNANTEGYSRQRVELSTRPAQFLGGAFSGKGVAITGIDRVVDEVPGG